MKFLRSTTLAILVLLLLILLLACSKKKTTEVVQQVAVPTFTLTSGVYTDPISVAIQCATEEVEIRYTTDGTTPTASSTLYQNPLIINQTRFIRAIAFKEGWNKSEVGFARYVYNPSVIEMIDIPGGTFSMGRTLGGEYHASNNDELPVHQVSISSFKMSKYEIDQNDWVTIAGTRPSTYSVTTTTAIPVQNVSWYGAIRYCNWRSLAENLTPCYSIKGTTNPDLWGTIPTYFNADWDAVLCNWDANGYRLPTEAEWEFAARGATTSPDYLYAGSDSLQEVGWFYDDASNPNPKGQKQANGLALHDMSGNVWEWCWDVYEQAYYSVSPVNNPRGPASGINRTLRGGSWKSDAVNCRVAERNFSVPYYKSNAVGFRVVRKGN